VMQRGRINSHPPRQRRSPQWWYIRVQLQ